MSSSQILLKSSLVFIFNQVSLTLKNWNELRHGRLTHLVTCSRPWPTDAFGRIPGKAWPHIPPWWVQVVSGGGWEAQLYSQALRECWDTIHLLSHVVQLDRPSLAGHKQTHCSSKHLFQMLQSLACYLCSGDRYDFRGKSSIPGKEIYDYTYISIYIFIYSYIVIVLEGTLWGKVKDRRKCLLAVMQKPSKRGNVSLEGWDLILLKSMLDGSVFESVFSLEYLY